MYPRRGVLLGWRSRMTCWRSSSRGHSGSLIECWKSVMSVQRLRGCRRAPWLTLYFPALGSLRLRPADGDADPSRTQLRGCRRRALEWRTCLVYDVADVHARSAAGRDSPPDG